jgi:soluble lytic murein transglycosylase-like protein
MKKILTVILSFALMLGSAQSISCSTNGKNSIDRWDKETVGLATKVMKFESKNKKKYEMKYKSTYDLLETWSIINNQSKYTSFDKYDVAAIVIRESRFKSDALNKTDGGKGLMQITGLKKWHQDTLFWVTNLENKHQNIIGGLIILEEAHKSHKAKSKAIKHFNGSNWKAEQYMKEVQKIKRELKAC